MAYLDFYSRMQSLAPKFQVFHVTVLHHHHDPLIIVQPHSSGSRSLLARDLHLVYRLDILLFGLILPAHPLEVVYPCI